jgi:hypothetical protein
MIMKHSTSFLILILGATIIALAIGYSAFKTGHNLDQGQHSSSAPSPSLESEPAAGVLPPDSEIREVSLSDRTDLSQLPPAFHAAVRPATTTAPVVPRVEASPYTRHLIGALTNINLNGGPITAEQAQQWKQTLQTLTAQGSAAVPAIREFLELSQELNFDAVPGGTLLGQSSLRGALIDALRQIGGPEATSLMLDTLRSTTLPSEIALLAQNLDQLAPGQYRQETLAAISDVLALASKGQLSGWDVGPLFQLLQSYGDPGSTAFLEQVQSNWKYYAAMSLAGLENGAGINTLIRQVQEPAGTGGADFAFQMLAQIASQNPAAGDVLLDLARRNQIPASAWRKIATGLAGEQYQIGLPPNARAISGLKTFHIESGNQNFYSLPLLANAPADEIERRRALINQLLAATGNSAASDALKQAQSTLPPN